MSKGKFYLDLEVHSSVPNAYTKSANELSQISGENLGNFVFRHALRNIVTGIADYFPVNYSGIAKVVAEKTAIERVVVSCANWLGDRDQDERSNKVRADIIEAIDAPVVSFGLGVQAKHGAEGIALGPESVRLAKVLASKAPVLGVRDELTAKVLSDLSIKNIAITGCPSNFINPDKDLAGEVSRKASKILGSDKDWKELRMCVSEVSGGHAHSGGVLARILDILENSPSFYVAQSPLLLPFILGEQDDLPPFYERMAARDGNYKKVLKGSALHFSSVEAWLDFCRTCQLSFGMRIHGTMVPLQAGVPSILIAHDARTAGLAEQMKVPQITPQEFLSLKDGFAEEMLGRVVNAMEGYQVRRSYLANVMREVCERNGIEVTRVLKRMAGDVSHV